MNILLTGSGGFIGKHLNEYLNNNYTVLAPRSRELNLLNLSEVDKYFQNHKIDLIIHCAAVGVRIKTDATNDDVAKPNITMFDNLVKHTSNDCKMIVLGSGAEYDKSNPIVNIKEEDFGKSIPQDPYGYSKYKISKKIENLDNILNLRLFGVYGTGESSSRVTSSIINSITNNNVIELNQNVRFSFIYIDDFCKIIEHFVQNFPKEKFINVAQPDTITIKKLAEIANSLNNGHSSIVFKKSGMNNEYTADTKLLKNLLKNFKFTPYESGLKFMFNNSKK